MKERIFFFSFLIFFSFKYIFQFQKTFFEQTLSVNELHTNLWTDVTNKIYQQIPDVKPTKHTRFIRQKVQIFYYLTVTDGSFKGAWTLQTCQCPNRLLLFDCNNCRETQESDVEFIPQLLTLPPPGTCLRLPLEPHLDCTVLKSSFWSRICTWKKENVSFQTWLPCSRGSVSAACRLRTEVSLKRFICFVTFVDRLMSQGWGEKNSWSF